MIDDKWLVYTVQKLRLRGETGHTCDGCCHCWIVLYCVVKQRSRQAGKKKQREGMRLGINREPLQQLSSTAPLRGDGRDSVRCLVKNTEQKTAFSRLPFAWCQRSSVHENRGFKLRGRKKDAIDKTGNIIHWSSVFLLPVCSGRDRRLRLTDLHSNKKPQPITEEAMMELEKKEY